ncbi:MAG: hypothetical protein EOO43_01860 [Flavobacterium sp.]|nr:MAG: hypothetical protein EOO43_01860 [Flavobacterium sp.]
MNKETIERKLNDIFDSYANKFKNCNLNRINERRFVYAVPEKSEILITGINPSHSEKYTDHPNHYTLKDASNRYFTMLRRVLPFEKNVHISYLDLFYFKNTEQAILNAYKKERDGLTFLAEQLNLTQHIIEWIAPKLILVMNKGSWGFWGKEKNCTWMGYEFELEDDTLEFGQLHKITGIRNDNDSIAHEIEVTSLIGTRVYFSRHLNRVKNETLEKIRLEVASIS